MHEIGVVRSMLRTVEDFARENGIDKVVTIVVEIGDLSMIVPKYVEEIYSAVVRDNALRGHRARRRGRGGPGRLPGTAGAPSR